MSQNHDIGDHEELPQIGPLIMDMKQQQRYILAGVLKVNTIELSYVHIKEFETRFCQKINAAHKSVSNHNSEQTDLNLVNIKHNKISKFLLRVVIWHIYLCCIEVSDKKLHLKPVMHTIS